MCAVPKNLLPTRQLPCYLALKVFVNDPSDGFYTPDVKFPNGGMYLPQGCLPRSAAQCSRERKASLVHRTRLVTNYYRSLARLYRLAVNGHRAKHAQTVVDADFDDSRSTTGTYYYGYLFIARPFQKPAVIPGQGPAQN